MIDFTAAENALHAWVTTATGLGAQQVVWPGGPRPVGAYVALRITGMTAIGRDSAVAERAATPTPGAELTMRITGARSARFGLQAFGAAGKSLLDRVVAAAARPTVRQALRVAGVGLGPIGAINVLDGDRDGLFEERAVLDIVIHVGSADSEAATYIQHVEIAENTGQGDRTSTVTGPPV